LKERGFQQQPSPQTITKQPHLTISHHPHQLGISKTPYRAVQQVKSLFQKKKGQITELRDRDDVE
jgi:hypothetical protein